MLNRDRLSSIRFSVNRSRVLFEVVRLRGYRLLNPSSFDKADKRLVRLLSGLVTRRLLARIVRNVGFVGLNCTDGSGCLPRVNGIDHMFSFLNLQPHG